MYVILVWYRVYARYLFSWKQNSLDLVECTDTAILRRPLFLLANTSDWYYSVERAVQIR